MNYRVQFLNLSAEIVAERLADAFDVAEAVALVDGIAWPDGASRMKILDEYGTAVHWRIKLNEPRVPPEGEGS
jgi:hypothetical protein